MRVVLGFAVLMCLAIVGFGAYLALEEQRQMMSYSATTTATVLEERLEQHERRIEARRPGRHEGGRSRFTYVPVVRYRYEAEGRQFTGASIFPDPFRIGGNLGYLAAKAPLDRFKVGQQTRAYYNPDNPLSACLIRRPSTMPYVVVLAPVIAASALAAAFWRSGRPGFKRRKAFWIAAVWHILGLTAAAHYFLLAGSEYGGGTLSMFAIYTQLGLVPVMFAMPPATSAPAVKRMKGVMGFSLFGTFVGFWLGLLIGFVTMKVFSASATTFLQCWGYTIAMSAGLFALLSLVGEWRVGGEREPPHGRSPGAEPAPQPGSVALPPEAPIPYRIDDRPMPSGEDLDELLPLQVGPFRREGLNVPDDLRKSSIYAQYDDDDGEIFVELGVCDDAETAWTAVETSKAETDAESSDAAQVVSLKTEPSFFKTNTRRGAFMSWSRGRYYFSAHARRGDNDLDRFLTAFPY
jgi:Protein of unknown function (DUF3592)